MSQASRLRSVLSRLKKKSLALPFPTESFESRHLLSALLLQVAAGQPYSAESRQRIARLHDRTRQLLPEAVRDALPMPTAEAFAQSLEWLAEPPKAVHDLDPCMLGYLYQFFSSSRRERAKQLLQTANKHLQVEETIAFTQLYTPTVVVDYLLAGAMAAPQAEGTSGKLPALLDPSCGAGNFLLRAFDLLLPRCVEAGMSAEQAARSALKECIHGCDIDRTGLWVAALSFAQRLEEQGLPFSQPLQLELLVEADAGLQLGTLRRDWPDKHLLSRRYDAVVGNPPYLGRKLLDRRFKQEMRRLYPDAAGDLCAAFIARGLELLRDGGCLGYITQSSLLYLPSYSKFRLTLIDRLQIKEVVELGTHVFPLQSGEKVNSMLLQLRNATCDEDGSRSVFKDLTACKGELTLEVLVDPDARLVRRLDQRQFRQCRGQAMNYRAPAFIIEMSGQSPKLSACAEVRQGLATGNNERFIKRHWQVPQDEIGTRWFPYVKGAGSERWFSPVETVIDWQDDGAAIKESVAKAYPYLEGKTSWVVKNERFYFRRGLTFSLVNTSQLAVRLLPEGCIFDVAGSAVFPACQDDEDWLLAYLNSSLVAAHADILNPTINYQVGDLKALPMIPLSESGKSQLAELSRQCVRLKKELCRFHPVRSDLPPLSPADWEPCAYQRWQPVMNEAAWQLPLLEADIDALVLEETDRRFHFSRTERQQLLQLCQQAAEKRKPAKPPFSNEAEYAALLSRLTGTAMPT